MRNFLSILASKVVQYSWLRRRWIHPRRIVFFIEEKQTENRVFGSNFLSILYARPSKVLTTEKLVFFRGDYEIESGQRNDTASGPRGRQAERPAVEFSIYICPAVESPHDRQARLFRDHYEILSGRQRYCFCSKRQTDRMPDRRKSSRQRGLSFQ